MLFKDCQSRNVIMSNTPPVALAWRLEQAESQLKKLTEEMDAMRVANAAKERRYLVAGISALGAVVLALAGVLARNLPEIIR
jgi:hypothetical protein